MTGSSSSRSNLRRTLHQPTKDNDGNTPLIAARAGTTLLAYGSIVYDTRLNRYVMFVQEFPSRQMYRLTSADGLAWQPNTHAELEKVSLQPHLLASAARCPWPARHRPLLLLLRRDRRRAAPTRAGSGPQMSATSGRASGTWTPPTACAGARARQVLSGFAGEGDPSCRAITQDGRTLYGPGDVTLFAHDAVENRFLGLFKFYSPRDLATSTTAPGPAPTRSWKALTARSTRSSCSASN